MFCSQLLLHFDKEPKLTFKITQTKNQSRRGSLWLTVGLRIFMLLASVMVLYSLNIFISVCLGVIQKYVNSANKHFVGF